MEFKGTKGKWELTTDEPFFQNEEYNGGFVVKVGESNTKVVEIMAYSFWNLTLEEAKANALLISKAPDMLEMLIRLNNINEIAREHINPSIFKDLEKLIKQATEL